MYRVAGHYVYNDICMIPLLFVELFCSLLDVIILSGFMCKTWPLNIF